MTVRLFDRISARRGDEGAAATILVIGLSTMLLVVAGLVVDGGLAINARERIADDAEQAARAGSQQLDEGVLRDKGVVVLDPGAAQGAAWEFLTARGYSSGTVTVAPDADAIEVRITSSQPTALLGLVGINSFPIEATARAHPEAGIDTGGAP